MHAFEICIKTRISGCNQQLWLSVRGIVILCCSLLHLPRKSSPRCTLEHKILAARGPTGDEVAYWERDLTTIEQAGIGIPLAKQGMRGFLFGSTQAKANVLLANEGSCFAMPRMTKNFLD